MEYVSFYYSCSVDSKLQIGYIYIAFELFLELEIYSDYSSTSQYMRILDVKNFSRRLTSFEYSAANWRRTWLSVKVTTS